MTRDDAVDGIPHRCGVGDIQRHDVGSCGYAVNLAGHGSQARFVACGQDDVRAGVRVAKRDFASNSATGAGDHCDSTSKTHSNRPFGYHGNVSGYTVQQPAEEEAATELRF